MAIRFLCIGSPPVPPIAGYKSFFRGFGGVVASAPACGFRSFPFRNWGVSHVTPPPPSPPDITPVLTPGGVGRAAWRDHYRKAPKKKKKLLEELDDALLDLQERIEESNAAAAQESEYLRTLQLGEDILANEQVAQLTLEQIRVQLAAVQEAIREIDDEEVLLLSVH